MADPIYIDPSLEKEIRRDPTRTMDIILVCPTYSSQMQEKLARAGFHLTGDELGEQGIVFGRIRLSDIENLKKVSGLESIELDAEQRCL